MQAGARQWAPFWAVFKNLSAVELGGAAIRGTVRDSGLDPDSIDEVIMGCVLPAGLGQAPARQAGFAGGLPERIPRYSGQQDVRFRHEGHHDCP